MKNGGNGKRSPVCEFGPFRFDFAQRILLRNDEEIVLNPKTLELLEFFLFRNNEVVGKDELMRSVWPGSFVEEANLTVHVSKLRKIFSTVDDGSISIETFPKKGYRFSAAITDDVNGTQHKDLKELGDEPKLDTARSSISPPKHKSLIWVRDNFGLSVAIALVVTAGLAAGITWYSKRPNLPFRNMRVSKITSSENVNYQVLSPDGKFIVYSKGGDSYLGGKSTLWVKQIATTSEIQLIPDYDFFGSSVRFMPDGQNIYFAANRDDRKSVIFKEPILGGAPTVLFNSSKNGYFSPKADRFAYYTSALTSGLTTISVSDIDGSNDRVLARRQAPNYFENIGPWSPDGRFILCYGRNAGEGFSRLILVNVIEGSETVIESRKWNNISGVSWLPDSSGVIMAATDELSAFAQIWLVSVPSGETTQITNDTNNYWWASASVDAKTITAIKRVRSAQIALIKIASKTFAQDNENPQIDVNASELISENKVDGYAGLDSTPDNRVVFTSTETGNTDIWIMNSDGSERRQLTTDQHIDKHPSVCGDGRYIVFTSNRTGAEHIWRMDMDGANQAQLTSGTVERFPQCSQDGQTVVYTSWETQKGLIWKISIDGRELTQLTKTASFRPIFSPDGSQIAYDFTDGNAAYVGIMSVNGGEPTKVLDLPKTVYEPQGAIRWAPDGRGLVIMGSEDGISNLWLQPLDGNMRKLTNFSNGGIWNHRFSDDGQILFISSGTTSSDVVLFIESQ